MRETYNERYELGSRGGGKNWWEGQEQLIISHKLEYEGGSVEFTAS